MDFMSVLGDQAGIIAAAGLILGVLALIVGLVAWGRANRAARVYRKLMMGREAGDIGQILLGQEESLRSLKAFGDGLERRIEEQHRVLQLCVQHVGVVRFNAFQGTGSDLSFSLALLDANRDGVVLTSLYGRDESRTYVKPIRQGTSTYHLSEEEKQALQEAFGYEKRREAAG